MKKAFLFDMDGVLADSETEWDRLGYDDLLKSHFGVDLFAKVKVKSGTSIKGIFDQFVSAGWNGAYEPFHLLNAQIAEQIYGRVELTPGLDELICKLVDTNYQVGVVSSSPREWIEMLISRLPSRNNIAIVVSVNNHPSLKSKPAPDPYLYAMQKLSVEPASTVVLEDSQSGVNSAKSAGAKVICFTRYNHGYDWQTKPINADYYAKSMQEVEEIVAKLTFE